MTRDEVINHLKALANNEVQPADPEHGLCWELFRHCKVITAHSLVDKSAKSWKHFSGDECFPVPDPRGLDSGKKTYLLNRSRLWSITNPYGYLRRSLCQHVADYLEANPEIKV